MNINNYLRKGLILSTAVWATACSDVSFIPSTVDGVSILPDGARKETFTFGDENVQKKVDVLFVVDNSPSMEAEQDLLGNALSSFISGLGQIDWQIGITTTDTSNGLYGIKGSLVTLDGTSEKILTKNTPNFASVFKESVKRDETINCSTQCPTIDERPLEAITMAIAKKDAANAGFFRDGADLAVVILSDEDERSTGGSGAMTAPMVAAAAQVAFGISKTFSAFGIVIEPGDTACQASNGAGQGSYGTHAAALALLTGGLTGSLCDADYGPTLKSIGSRVLNLVKSVTLKYTPDPSTIEVIVLPQDSSLSWSIVGNQVIFNKAPQKGTRVDVIYHTKDNI